VTDRPLFVPAFPVVQLFDSSIFFRSLSVKTPLSVRWLGLVSLSAAATTLAVAIGFVLESDGAPPTVHDPGLHARGLAQFTMHRHSEFGVGITKADSPTTAHRMFNARSCAECHRQGGVGGAGPNENNVRLINKVYSNHDPQLAKHFGAGQGVAVVHRQSTAPEYAEWRLALIEKFAPHEAEVAPRLQLRLQQATSPSTPARVLFCCGVGRPPPFEQRNTPALFGLGQIESIPQSVIDDVAASQEQAIRGHSPRLKEGGRGRFGWKSSTATLAAFNENACAVELGLSTARFTPATFDPAAFKSGSSVPRTTVPQTNASIGPAAPRKVDMTDADLAALNRFVADLPTPRQIVDPTRKELIAEGATHFKGIGCADCHRANLGEVAGLYSDLLLHSVGTSGGGFYGDRGPTPDGKQPDFDIVRADEFRTPPLWGVADSAPYLHDGSAATLEEAILRHHGQAAPANTAYQQRLSNKEREALLAFLGSLRAPRP
jgi:CxxC motif-containing protein (DUF1111 family)